MPSFSRLLGGLDAFPGGGELDQDALAADAGLLVGGDDLAGRGDRFLRVIREAGIHLGRDAAGDDLEDALAELDGELLEGEVGDLLLVGAFAELRSRAFKRTVNDVRVLGHLRRSGDKRRICGRILRLEFLDGIEVAGIGDDSGHAAKLL